MTTYVLLHGGAAGSWIWDPAAKLLRDKGHLVLCVTFTGFAERNHLLSAECSAQLHVQDVLQAMKFHDVRDAVLVAHSYSGIVAPGVVARAPAGTIRRVIYLDSVVLHEGETVMSVFAGMPAEQVAGMAAGLAAGAVPLELPVATMQRDEAAKKPMRMSAERQQWVLDHLSTMPTAANVVPVEVGAESIKLPVDYIACSDTVMKPTMHDRARKLGWSMHEVDGDHVILVGDPQGTVALLEKLS